MARKGTNRGANDADLLNRFVASQDEDAFVRLLERSCRLVWDVCRRVHRNAHDAEDSFQATFFVFARKAGQIRSSGSLACWLYRLAYRTAMHAKKNAYRRRLREEKVAVPADRAVSGSTGLQELQAVLDEEVNRLAEKHSAPFVRCCLQGKSKSAAAAELGWKEGTVSSRLAQARKLLQERLTQRGITLSAVLTAGAVGEGTASAAIPMTLLTSTAQGAFQFGLGQTRGVADSAALANGVLKAIAWQKLRIVGAIILATTVLGTGTTVAGYGAFGAKLRTLQAESNQSVEKPASTKKKQLREDFYGDPLPQGAIARLGTVRWRNDTWIGSLVISPDNKRLVAGGTVWDRATGRILRRIEARPGEYGGFSADPERMVFYGDDYVVMREIRTQVEIWRQTDPGKRVFTVVSSPDGKWTAVVCSDSMIRILDAQTGRQLRQFDGFGGQSPWPPGAEFSPDGKIIATYNALNREALRLVDVATGKLLHQLKFSSFAFAPDSKTLARVLIDSNQFEHSRARIHFLDIRTGKELRKFEIPLARGLKYSPDGKILALSAGWYAGQEIHLLDSESGKHLRTLEESTSYGDHVTFSADGSMLASTSRGTIQFWKLSDGKLLNRVRGHSALIQNFELSHDGTLVFTKSDDGTTRSWHAISGKHLRIMDRRSPYSSWYDRMKASADNRFLFASNPQDKVLTVSDVATGKEIKQLRFNESIPSFDLSPDGSLLAIALGRSRPGQAAQLGGAISVRDLSTDKEVSKIQLPENEDLNELGFSRNGTLILTASKATAGNMQVFSGVSTWDPRCGKKLHEWKKTSQGWQPLKIYTQDFTSMIVQEHGNRYLHYVVEARTGKVLQRFPGQFHQQDPLAFSPDLRTMVKNNCELEIWELATGKLRRRFAPGNNHQIAVQVRFSQDSKRLVTSGMDSFAHVWDLVGIEQSEIPISKDIPTLWADLRDEDAVKAGLAIRRLINAPDLTLSFLKNHLHAESPVDPRTIARLVKELNSERFAVRKQASAEIEKLGEEVVPELKRVLKDKPSLEVSRRLQALLEKYEYSTPPERLRSYRAVEVLEHIATQGADANRLAMDAQRSAAIDLLKKLAAGASEARLTQEANAALRRLKIEGEKT